jgi:hypothetical protein
MNNVFRRIWKEAAVVYITTPSKRLIGGTKENHENSVRIASLWAQNRNQCLATFSCGTNLVLWKLLKVRLAAS